MSKKPQPLGTRTSQFRKDCLRFWSVKAAPGAPRSQERRTSFLQDLVSFGKLN